MHITGFHNRRTDDTQCMLKCILCHNHCMPNAVKKPVPIKSFNVDCERWTDSHSKFCHDTFMKQESLLRDAMKLLLYGTGSNTKSVRHLQVLL